MIAKRPQIQLENPAEAVQLDLNLARKYAVPGPRYTSYPTALQFSDAIEAGKLIDDAGATDGAANPISLYIHLPFCETACWFCGCTKVITKDRSSADRYLDYLEKEIAFTAERIQPNQPVVQLHFGGGTPTFLSPDQLRRLGVMLHRFFRFAPDCEAGVEIDPRRLTREHIVALREIGCNRASLGVQDNNPAVQEAINRIQPPELTKKAISWLRDEGFGSINIDLIYGLPLQTVASFDQTLADVLELEPDRFAIFSYAHVPWIKPAQKIFDKRGNLPDAESKLAILDRVVETLTSREYCYIGMDHFSRLGDELELAQANGTLQRNFQGYSTKGGTNIVAFGMSAISQSPRAYRQNEKELPAYYAALDEGRLPTARGYFLTGDDQIRRETIMRLMCDLRIDFNEMSEKLGVDFREYFSAELSRMEPFVADDLLRTTGESIVVTGKGRFFIRNIAMTFDAYLKNQENRFSKTV
ncbi:MAG: oxygen-independent coproporphyrinogen III oxidase [Opitutales bacterium]